MLVVAVVVVVVAVAVAVHCTPVILSTHNNNKRGEEVGWVIGGAAQADPPPRLLPLPLLRRFHHFLAQPLS